MSLRPAPSSAIAVHSMLSSELNLPRTISPMTLFLDKFQCLKISASLTSLLIRLLLANGHYKSCLMMNCQSKTVLWLQDHQDTHLWLTLKPKLLPGLRNVSPSWSNSILLSHWMFLTWETHSRCHLKTATQCLSSQLKTKLTHSLTQSLRSSTQLRAVRKRQSSSEVVSPLTSTTTSDSTWRLVSPTHISPPNLLLRLPLLISQSHRAVLNNSYSVVSFHLNRSHLKRP